MSFSEQLEAKCVDRQAHFQDALINGKPLLPEKGRWTWGDTIYLRALLNTWAEPFRDVELDEDALLFSARALIHLQA